MGADIKALNMKAIICEWITDRYFSSDVKWGFQQSVSIKVKTWVSAFALSESVQRTLQHRAEADSDKGRTLTSRRLCIQQLSEAGCLCFSGSEHTLHWICRAERVAPPHVGHRRFDTQRLSDIHTNKMKRRCNRHANGGPGPCGSPGEALSLPLAGL